MTRTLTLLLFLLYGLLNAQPYNWQWIRSAQGNKAESVTAITCDPSGNIIVTGYYYTSTLTIGNSSYGNQGNYDLFVISYDPSGNVLWSLVGGGIYDDVGKAVITDGAGNIYVSGYFYSPVLSISSTTIVNNGVGDGFIIKMDPSGNLLWVKGFGGNGDESINGLSSDGSDVFMTGFFQSDTIICGPDTLMNSGNHDAFVGKINSSGSFIWCKGFKGMAADAGYAVCNDPGGNVFLTGSFYSPKLICAQDTLFGKGSSDVMLCKISGSGTVLWSRSIGGNYNDAGYAMACDKNGELYLTGTFKSTTLTAGGHSLINQGNFDVFLSRYSANGNAAWMLSEGGIFDDTGYGLAADQSGNAYLTGHFHSPAIILGNDTIQNEGIGDIYVSAYDASGHSFWSTTIGNTADDGSSAVAIDASDNLYVGGYFISPTLSCASGTLINSGGEDLFIGKLERNQILTSVKAKADGSELLLFPNPGTGVINIYSADFVEYITVFDSNGIQVFSAERNCSQIDLSALAKGIYTLRIRSAGLTSFHRLALID